MTLFAGIMLKLDHVGIGQQLEFLFFQLTENDLLNRCQTLIRRGDQRFLNQVVGAVGDDAAKNNDDQEEGDEDLVA